MLGVTNSEKNILLGKILRENAFESTFLELTKDSTGIKQPVILFKQYTKEEVEAWRDKFKGGN